MTTQPTQNTDIHARMKLLLEALNHSANSFARLVGINPSQIVKVVAGSTKPSTDTLEKISLTIPRLNLDWLVVGRGEMMKPYPGQEQSATNSGVMVGHGNVVGSGNKMKVRTGGSSPALEDCQKELQHWIEKAHAFEQLAEERKTVIELLKKGR